MFYFCAQFLPDDDEATAMFTVVIDKEIAQQEKKKKTTATAGTFLSSYIYSLNVCVLVSKDLFFSLSV